MEAMPSTSKVPHTFQQNQLLQLARRSIEHGVARGTPIPVVLDEFHSDLQESGATFVTLHKNAQLRGCIGNLVAHQSLARDVADNAFSAAFKDPRFPGVTGDELQGLHIEISVLTPHVPIVFSSESELLEALNPNVDGVVLEDGYFRSTFLPSVWQQLPDKRVFLNHLKLKAGMSIDHWSQSIKAFRYHTISFEE